MSDLMDKISWLREHDDAARRIGENGRVLAMSLSYNGELRAAGRTISAAARYFGGRPETELHFGSDLPGDVGLLGGWTGQRDDGLQAMGQESRLDLPRPIASESFVLTLDVSPVDGPAAPPAQRVTVVVNAETLRETVVSTRRLIRCRVPRRTIDTADRLVITLLLPDATCLASASHPLDERSLSIILHGLTLTPISIDTKSNALAIEVFRPESMRPTREPFLEGPYGPDIWIPPEARLSRIRTHWGTVLFSDTTTGVLRHGAALSVPENVKLADNQGTAYLLYTAPDGDQCTMRIAPMRRNPVEEPTQSGFPAGLQTFRRVAVTASERSSFGLRSGGLLLCAETDGRVTLSRNTLGPWERFEFIDPG
jgi:hypothetical protein